MKKLILLLTMFLMTTAWPLARAASSDTPDTPAGSAVDVDDRRGDTESDLYAEGTDAIDEEEWMRAIDTFKKVVAMKGKRVDGALYWMAYAQHKAGRGGEALKTIDALERAHPQSRWIKDAKALELDIKRSSGQRVDPSKVDDEELKLIVIQGLMSSDPQRALPLLKKLVEGPYSRRVKEQALFVLSQSDAPEAAQLIASIARGTAHAELQSDAIKYLGISGQRNLKLLGEVYQSTANAEVKKEILRAYMIAGAKQPIYVAAKSEKDPKLRKEAIRQLGVAGAGHELQEMYRSETSADVKRTIIESLFVGGNVDMLLEIARNESDPNLRATAVRTLGLMGRERTGATLVQMYRGESDAHVRRAALEGLFVQGNARALVELAKSEKDPRWKREIVQQLAVMNSKDAADYLTDLLKD
jgi:HEAT repeat protein